MFKIIYNTEKNSVFDFSINYNRQSLKNLRDTFGLNVDIAYYQAVFMRSECVKLIDIKRMIWSTHIIYELKGKVFGMVYDEDYQFISNFYVDNPEDRKEVSSYLFDLLMSYFDSGIKIDDGLITFVNLVVNI